MPEQRRAASTERCSDPACRYRQLYEGSQTSLADMAGKQAAALRSLGATKKRISDLIKQHFPDAHKRIERSLGHRFADASDEIVLSYLEQLVGEAIAPLAISTPRNEGGGADLLRAALRRAGYPVGDDTDLAAWAAIVERTEPPRRTPPADPAPTPTGEDPFEGQFVAPPTEHAEEPELEDLFDSPAADGTPAADDAAGFEDLFEDAATAAGDDEPLDLDDLFGHGPGAEPPAPAAEASTDRAGAEGLEDLFDDAASTPAGPQTPSAAPGADGLDDLFGDEAPPAPAGGIDELFDELFDDAASTPAGPQTPSATPGADGLDDLFGDDPGPEQAAAPDTPGDLEGLFEDPAEAAPPTAEAAPPTAETDPKPAAHTSRGGEWTSTVDAEALTVPIRPELVAGRSTKTRKRKPRTRADRPNPARDLDTEEPAVEVERDVADRIAAAVAIPRPMFNSDLVSVAGDRDTLDAWSQEMLNLGAVAPVRFVVAKARHRALGPLVLPHGELRAAATEFDNSWWAQVMDRYHGTALYELAVLLSRVGDQVQATDLWDTAARFRLDTPRGLVGLVVHLSGGLGPDDLGRAELDEALAGFSRERFTLVAVLNVVANPAALDQLVDTVAEIAEDRQWRPAYPVVATQTWEWAANSGRTARLVLGG